MNEIKPNDAINSLLECSSGFAEIYKKLIEEYGDDRDVDWKTSIEEYGGLYGIFNELARYVAGLYKESKNIEIQEIFNLVEEWHKSGTEYLQESTTVGFLEDLSNLNAVGNIDTNEFLKFMGPETKYWWNEVREFWDSGKIIGIEKDL